MIWSLVPARSDESELMDSAGPSQAEVASAYRVLRRVNRQLGNLGTMSLELDRACAEDDLAERGIVLLDVGSGAGDIPDALGKRFRDRRIGFHAVGIDRDSVAVQLTASTSIDVVRGDALRLPFPDRCFDIVTAVKFAHHFAGHALRAMVSEMARVARRRVIILDIRRHWLAYWGFFAWSRILTRNRLVRYDGPVSVLRGFTCSELLGVAASIPEFAWTVRRYAGFQLALVGRRVDLNVGY